MPSTRTPVVFIHGMWLHASCWDPWLELFAAAGYDPIAPGWPGEPGTVPEAMQHPELVANTSIDDITAHYTTIIDSLDASPILIGHSLGGLFAEKLLGQGVGVAGVAIDPAQIKGVLPLPLAQLRAALPALGNPANLHKSVSPDGEGIPVRLRQRSLKGRVRRAVRPVGDSLTGEAAVRSRDSQFLPPLAGEGQHRQRNPRAAAAYFRRRGPHSPGRQYPLNP